VISLDALAQRHARAFDMVAAEYEQRSCERGAGADARIVRLAGLLAPPASVLDVGCGVGTIIRGLLDHGFDASGIELSPEMARRAMSRTATRVTVGDVRHMKPSPKFDCVLADALIHLFPASVATHVFEHLTKFLVPGGLLSMSTTLHDAPSEGWSRKADYASAPLRYRRRFAGGELRALFAGEALRIIDSYETCDHVGKTWLVMTGARPHDKS
jgi:SAM-dependent methyltransferase